MKKLHAHRTLLCEVSQITSLWMIFQFMCGVNLGVAENLSLLLIMFWVEGHHDFVHWQHVGMWDLGDKVMRMRKASKHNISILRFPNEGSETDVSNVVLYWA